MNRIASLWIGDRLGPLEILSAQSFLATGHSMTIFAYGPLADVPDGVRVLDAEPVFSGERILRYPGNGWPSIHSNLFRYAMLERFDHVWSDLDVIALRPFEFASPYVFGFERNGSVNNAILGLPNGSPTLSHLRRFGPGDRGYPPDADKWQRRRLWLRSLGRGMGIEHWGHGATGPRAVTHFLRETGEIMHAQPAEAFYPVPWEDHARIVAPGAINLDMLPRSARAIHLWGSHVRRVMKWRYRGQIPRDSLLGQLRERHGPARLSDRTPDAP